MSWPQTELEWWSVVFSVRDNKDKPIMKDDDPYLTDYKQRRADFMRVMEFGREDGKR